MSILIEHVTGILYPKGPARDEAYFENCDYWQVSEERDLPSYGRCKISSSGSSRAKAVEDFIDHRGTAEVGSTWRMSPGLEPLPPDEKSNRTDSREVVSLLDLLKMAEGV